MNDYPTTDEEIREFVKENREMLTRVLRHGNDGYARACAWALLDRGGSDPDLEKIEQELQELKKHRGVEA
ncbi:hypothetical protein [Natronoglomus mannanivorans]|uniref:Uncharacterized protein n=1 Tax=Natronoglomus mannanivorans TaxID=2979990 RepID=A0AAP2Z211_9EURY|nr:hypothetical protein [Halobacteria archaeon AArc-xg1-1]